MTQKRILIFNVNWMGDVLFSTATIRNIRRNFPEGFIACIIPPRCYPILKGNPHLDEIIIFDEKDRHRGLREKLNFVRFLKEKNFDTVFLLHRSFTRTLICRLAGIKERIGYYTRKRGFLLTKAIIPPGRDELHRIDYYLNIIKNAGLKVEDSYLEFFISDEDKKAIDEFLKINAITKADFLVAINPGGNWLPKRWPLEYWARTCDYLIGDFNCKVIITGSVSDVSLAQKIKKLMLEKPIIAAGKLNISQLGALCQRLNLFISADTGPLHIANAVGTKKIIALFGPTSPLITGPRPVSNVIILFKDIGCKTPCYVRRCKDNRCMKVITPDELREEIKQVLTQRNQ
ncbi:MAG: glycosyltransferase family 9 protein [Candidatus Omnitrophica bacterium]|nr:glycosyltransferase family 9 protein [Candidatus Omnitrophota bacterium]